MLHLYLSMVLNQEKAQWGAVYWFPRIPSMTPVTTLSWSSLCDQDPYDSSEVMYIFLKRNTHCFIVWIWILKDFFFSEKQTFTGLLKILLLAYSQYFRSWDRCVSHHSLSKYLFSTFCVPSTILGVGAVSGKQKQMGPPTLPIGLISY